MGSRTGVIRFNVRERGRTYRGVDRNFDTAVLADIINGGDVQERVQNGDMLGYYGHWPRLKFGMNLSEGGVIGGKAISVEPAIRTVYLKAHPDGTIEHEAEFLDTAPGKLAERLFKSRAGGFSSAIDIRRAGSVQVPVGFFGFDYVLEPNFTKNRGYTLDGVEVEDEEVMAVLDEVSQYNSLLDSTNRILDQIQSDYERLADVAERLEEENLELRSMLVRAGRSTDEIALDGVLDVVRTPRVSRFDRADEFEHAPLAGYETPQDEQKAKPKRTAADDFLSRMFGVR